MIEEILHGSASELIARAILYVAGAATLIQITPIKINPWSWLAKRIGKAINEELLNKVDALDKEVKDMQATIDEQGAKDARSKILHFGDSLIFYPERKYSKDRFDEIVACVTEYNQYCDEHPKFKNHMTATTSEMILSEYRKRMENHDFV